jgi:hypothetical protein
VHALDHLLLREAGMGARLDHCRHQRELLLEDIVGLLVFGTLAPAAKDSSTGIIFLLMSPPPRDAMQARFLRLCEYPVA